MHEYISQKRDIFRVDLVNTSIQKEMKEIEGKDVRRQAALALSEKELELDKKKALEFLNKKDNEEKSYKQHKETL